MEHNHQDGWKEREVPPFRKYSGETLANPSGRSLLRPIPSEAREMSRRALQRQLQIRIEGFQGSKAIGQEALERREREAEED